MSDQPIGWYETLFFKSGAETYNQRFFHKEQDGLSEMVEYFMERYPERSRDWAFFLPEHFTERPPGYCDLIETSNLFRPEKFRITQHRNPLELTVMSGFASTKHFVTIKISSDLVLKINSNVFYEFVDNVRSVGLDETFANLRISTYIASVPAQMIRLLKTHDWSQYEARIQRFQKKDQKKNRRLAGHPFILKT